MLRRNARRLLLSIWCVWPALLLGAPGAAAISGQKIAPPKILVHVTPEYPEDARQARIQGVVVIEATIGPDGRVRAAKVIGSIPLLDEAALAAVRKWQYEPTLVNGVATPVIMTVRVTFSLSDPATSSPSTRPAAPTPGAPAPAGPATAPATPGEREWEKVSPAASKLALDDKATEAVAMVQKFIARFPNVADAHYLLASLHEQLSGFGAPQTAAQRRHLETAVKHFARSAELYTAPDMRYVLTWKLSRIYGADQLNVPAEAERYARRLVDEHPGRAESHMVLAQLLHERGDIAAAADVLRQGRGTSELPVPGLLMLMQYSLEQVQTSQDLAPDAVRALLDDASRAADAILAGPKDDDRDYRLATFGKATVLSLQAEREPDRKRRLALIVESERWGAPIAEHANGAPPRARALSAAEAATLEWDYVRRWYSRIADEGRLEEAIRAFEDYLREGPQFASAHTELAELSLRGARESQDGAQRAAYFGKAGHHLQQVIESTKDDLERDRAFSQLLDVYGPEALNQPAQQETTARTMIKRFPIAPVGHAKLVAVLLQSNRSAEADKTLRAARAATRATSSSRAALAGELLKIIRSQPELGESVARRLFADADALVSEAEKLNPNDPLVLEVRAGWLNLSADRMEKDPSRANEQREQSQRLLMRAIELHERAMKKPFMSSAAHPRDITATPDASAPNDASVDAAQVEFTPDR